jgi:hypothetical protein
MRVFKAEPIEQILASSHSLRGYCDIEKSLDGAVLGGREKDLAPGSPCAADTSTGRL